MAIDKPVIAAVNGPVAGMSFAFVAACDIRIVAPEAMFLTAFAARGLIAEWGLAWLLPRLVGPEAALDLQWSSRRVTGEEAVRLRLASQLVESNDDLLPACRRYVEQLASNSSPTSLAIMKRQVYGSLHRGLGSAEQEARLLMEESFKRPDFKEGVNAFLERRPPSFVRLPAADARQPGEGQHQ
jgi:enoyl-CoA hydratase/carnithine racemase